MQGDLNKVHIRNIFVGYKWKFTFQTKPLWGFAIVHLRWGKALCKRAWTILQIPTVHCYKRLFCFGFPSLNCIAKHGKSSWYYRNILPATHRVFFTLFHAGKVLRTLEGDLVHFPIPEMPSCPWSETFWFPHAWKVYSPLSATGLRISSGQFWFIQNRYDQAKPHSTETQCTEPGF